MSLVHYIYLVPSDKEIVAGDAILKTALHHQCWYRWQMANGKTFELPPGVQAYQTDHDSNWYANNPVADIYRYWYWDNALADAARYAGAGFGQPDNWMIYVDAPTGVAQTIGGVNGGTNGLAVMSAWDVSGIMGLNPHWPVCVARGGNAHELGHTFGLAHPDNDPHYNQALMGTGYTLYPNCILVQDDLYPQKDQLNASPFFSFRQHQPLPDAQCYFFDGRPQPPPRPRPTLHPRPI